MPISNLSNSCYYENCFVIRTESLLLKSFCNQDTQESVEPECRKDSAITAEPCVTTMESFRSSTTTSTTTPAQTPTTPQTTQLPPLLVTDSWRLANKGLVVTEIPTPPSQESSSDSIFTDPGELTMSPVTAATKPEMTKCKPIPEAIDSKEEKASFTISKHKKIHLSVISPRISEDNFIDFS